MEFAGGSGQGAFPSGCDRMGPIYLEKIPTAEMPAAMNKRPAGREREPDRISVAMATYNGEKYIREQLDSIARQSLLPYELVVTDDGSTDGTLEMVEDFARSAPFPVKIHRNDVRLGFADNFFKAASLCEGELIAFSDQDDVWLEDKLSVCSSHFVDPDVFLVAHSAWTLLASGER
ncbi:MAG: glycosyltransferase, partial [Acidobacteriaceae bacterium]